MHARKSFRPAALALALGLAGLAPSAQALNFVFHDVGATPMSSEQLGAFQVAANYWKSQLTDNVTVYLNIGFNDLGANTLGSTTWEKVQLAYTDVRSRLSADRTSATDAAAVSHLQTGSALSFIATQPNLTQRLDNETSGINANDNRYLVLTSANAKALGVDRSAFDQGGTADATITFSTGYASNFAYSRVNGQVPSGKLDFLTVAEHEIGHALGFVSGVDDIDYCAGHADQCGTAAGFDKFVWYTPLDLYRYTAPGVLNEAVGGNPYFSIDGGATNLQYFATGRYNGNGQQASHFSGSTLSLMQPTVSWGASYDASSADLKALDAIGWNLAVAVVPEPQSAALLLCGLAGVAWLRRRK